MTTKNQQLLRDLLEQAKTRMLLRGVANANARGSKSIANTNNSSPSSSALLLTELTTNANIMELVLGVGYIFIIIAFLMKLLLRTIRNFEYHISRSYNRFGFIMNEESDSDSDSDSDSETDTSDVESSLSSSPVSLRPALSGKYLHLQTPLQTPVQTPVHPQTPQPPQPLRRSLRLKIKSELNLCAMQNNLTTTTTAANKATHSETKQSQNMTISSDPCPSNRCRNSMMTMTMTTPSPHPEHDEERAYYIRYCNKKKMMKKRPEFNSPIFIRPLVL
jgi:hypothetical protein